MNVKKAVFPVAGLGTRFLPATKASPKEMMPIVDMPLIQYAVNEAVLAGITELIFVTNGSKRAIENHFDSNHELESNLVECGKYELLDIVRNILPAGISCAYVNQKLPLGLGHAVLCAKELVGNEPFAVLLADDLIDGGKKSCLQQMIDAFQMNQSSIIAVQKIPLTDTEKYGVIDSLPGDNKLAEIQGIVEKPAPANAPSDLAVVGRYILTPRIFALLEQTGKGSGDEIQLTDAIAKLLLEQPVYSLQFQGKRYDCGSKMGYLEASVAFALKHPELAHDFKQFLRDIVECMA
ncbi:MAG: UTP--glucose-1-phosphate uridylyltransferase GalU [Gammaproteobacteria bacterium]